ncbi:hypothetical protein PUNSTDRAFT_58119 [Punctularia strigosozonata HHB-11173 SS5]|uniref:uncharacterized protein n=1 Tax=Punctularia strigosozonata (strain HHB-11173) TaxID=741275 RepID=UPI0004418475|nr:uncharacterized protein PUNSTDRAFT_58119 [Punctularia strigosozonata HHB-11173 SS5]EIN14599.1 hypothetical protein PUNSTDRAFT_58119 [Punctularia strigosozonata HHB-11173 SS5]
MATPPTPQALRSLYASTLRTARSFSSYNFREYFVRRTKDEWKPLKTSKLDDMQLSSFYNNAVQELAVLRRSAIVNQLYGGWKLVVEKQSPKRLRGVN